MTHRIIASLVLAALSLPAFAEEPAKPADEDAPRKCAFARQIDGWSYVDDKTIMIKQGVSHEWKVTLIGNCSRLNWVHAIGVKSRGAGCVTSGDQIVYEEPGMGHGTCTIDTIEYAPRKSVTPAEGE